MYPVIDACILYPVLTPHISCIVQAKADFLRGLRPKLVEGRELLRRRLSVVLVGGEGGTVVPEATMDTLPLLLDYKQHTFDEGVYYEVGGGCL